MMEARLYQMLKELVELKFFVLNETRVIKEKKIKKKKRTKIKFEKDNGKCTLVWTYLTEEGRQQRRPD